MSRNSDMPVATESALAEEPWLESYWRAGDSGIADARRRWQYDQQQLEKNPEVRVSTRATTPAGLLTTMVAGADDQQDAL